MVGQQGIGVHFHLILLDVAADGSNLGYTLHGLQRITEVPVLNGSELRQIVLARFVYQRIFIHPADARGIRPQRGIHADRQFVTDEIQILQHARTSPVHVRAILEEDVDEGKTEE